MLSSITPLGERGRGNRWWVTVTAYVVGSTAGGAAVGAVTGGAGLLPPRRPDAALGAIAAVALAGALCEREVGPFRLPSNHRQVDERWLDRYRGWVYGVGYGFQLGTGIVTIVTSATTYVALAAAFFAHSAAAGLLIGATFGLARAIPVLMGSSVGTPARLRELHRRNARWALRMRHIALSGELATCCAAIVAILMGT